MALALKDIRFGKIDAKNEVFTQAREGSYVLLNAFQMPPSVDWNRLNGGSNFFIVGPKGSGKTSLLLYLKDQIEKTGGKCEAILFKTKLSDQERNRIISLTSFSAFVDQNKISYQYDYSPNWLWFIITELSRLIEASDVLEGREELQDLRILTGVNRARQSIFGGLQLTKAKAHVEAALSAGPLKSSIKAEIEAITTDRDRQFLEIVDICERALSGIRLLPGRRVCLFFDELELFANQSDQKDRDLNLIKDLIRTVSRINQSFGAEGAAICVYASVRSEVLYELNRLAPELQRDIRDLSATISWAGKSSSDDHAILKIIDAKIAQSEAEQGLIPSEDVWATYFSRRIGGKTASQYLLDISMFKPRALVSILSNVATHFPSSTQVTEREVYDTEAHFSADMWTEVEDELRTSYSAAQMHSIKKMLSGCRKNFNKEYFLERIRLSSAHDPEIRKILGTSIQAEEFLKTLYRTGAIGTFIPNPRRDAWVFREHFEPHFENRIQFHQSLSKALQLT